MSLENFDEPTVPEGAAGSDATESEEAPLRAHSGPVITLHRQVMQKYSTQEELFEILIGSGDILKTIMPAPDSRKECT
jgi:hypothetical protein